MSWEENPSERQAFRRRVKAWYAKHGRLLPWRATDDPYRIWISEVMLQQTTVAAVIPYFERFVAAFPNVESLADAEEEAVLRHWEGLGYYSRARNLRKAAQAIVGDFGGEFPRSVRELESLPGIGRYTAGAIASFAFGVRAPIVEANTERLYARLIALDEPTQSTAGKKRLWKFAEAILPRSAVGDFNQALMDLGSQICRPTDPACDDCPVQPHCAAHRQSRVADYPRPKPRATLTDVTEAAVVLRHIGKVLLRQRPADERWTGLWDFPRFELANCGWLPKLSGDPQPVLPGLLPPIEEGVRELVGASVSIDRWWAEIRHGVTRYRIRLLCFGADVDEAVAAAVTNDAASDAPPLRWVDSAAAGELPLTRTARQLADLVFRESGHG